jgi:hypothetical protein
MNEQYYNQTKRIDTGQESDVFALIAQDGSLSNYFFQRVRELKWFHPLKQKGYFLPDRIPSLDNGKIDFWNVLIYLEYVSGQLTENPQYGEELIGILNDIFQFSKGKRPIDNTSIWWYCAKILQNIPFSLVRRYLPPDTLHSWLTTWLKYSSLALSDICNRLLPKMLNEEGASEYLEAIIDSVFRIESARRPISKKDVLLFGESYLLLDAFQKNNLLLCQKLSLNTIMLIANKLKIALEFAQQKDSVLVPLGTDVFKIEVSRIAKEDLGAEEIGFKDGSFECCVKKYAKDQTATIDQDSLWTLHQIEPETLIIGPFKVATVDKGAFVKDLKRNLPSNIRWETDPNLEKNIAGVFSSLFSDYTYIHFKSLTNITRNYSNRAEETLIIVLRDLVLKRCEINREDGGRLLERLFSSEYPFPIYRRLALICVDKFWSNYSSLFDTFLEIIPRAISEPHFEVELYDLFTNHCQDLSLDAISEIKRQIIDISDDYPKQDEFVAHWQFKWLSPLREHPEFKPIYEAVKQKVNPKDGKPYAPERSITSWTILGHKSPLDANKILSMPVAEFVKFAKEFKGQFSYRFNPDDEPDKVGLADEFQMAVKADPKKFTAEIDALKDSEYLFVTRFYHGLKDAWNDNQDIEWEKALKFAISYFSVDADAFRKQVREEQTKEGWGQTSNIWLITEIADLIKDGCKSDSRPFDISLFELIEQLYQKMLPIIDEKPEEVKLGDALFHALNCTLGKAISSYISLSLRISREKKKRMEENWGRRRYERFFESGIDAYIWFGDYLPQINYLDPDYTKNKVAEFADKDAGDHNWQMFMEGYLYGAQVYGDLYCLMRPHYAKAIQNDVFGEKIDQRLVEHIALGYLHFGEMLQEKNADNTDSLFWKLLLGEAAPNRKERWLKVPGFFWSITAPPENSKEQFNDRTISFWKWTYDERERVKAILGDSYSSFLSKMSTLTSVLGKIDSENEKWLLLSAPFIDIENIEHNSSFVLERFTKFEDTESIARIGKIFLKILENTTPGFDEVHIKLIVERMYKNGSREDADAICNTYGRRGIHFLKSLWEEFQKK